jgi:hypothetical protein
MADAVVKAISAGTDVQSAGWKKNQPWARHTILHKIFGSM